MKHPTSGGGSTCELSTTSTKLRERAKAPTLSLRSSITLSLSSVRPTCKEGNCF